MDSQSKVRPGLVQVHCQSFNGDMLYEPWEVLSSKGQPFTCFQDFWDRSALHPPAFVALNVPATDCHQKPGIPDLGMPTILEVYGSGLQERGFHTEGGLFSTCVEQICDYFGQILHQSIEILWGPEESGCPHCQCDERFHALKFLQVSFGYQRYLDFEYGIKIGNFDTKIDQRSLWNSTHSHRQLHTQPD